MSVPDTVRSHLRDRYLSLNWDAPWTEVVAKLASIRGAAFDGIVYLNREYIDSIPYTRPPERPKPLTLDDI